MPFHIFMLPEEHELKVIMSEIPYSTDPDSMKEELESKSFTPTTTSHLTTKNHSQVNSLLVKIKRVFSFTNFLLHVPLDTSQSVQRPSRPSTVL